MLFEIKTKEHTWVCTYDKARRENGELFFPERLSAGFLDEQRKVLGPYIYANQYQNEIIPAEDQDFKHSWLKHCDTHPKNVYTFAFIDPAISQQDHADFTALVVVHVDCEGYWYVEVAKRHKINATDTVRLMFDVQERYNPLVIGVEVVAYQEALLHILDEEMSRRQTVLPVKDIRRVNNKGGGQTITRKEQRILSLVPRYEWGRIYHYKGLTDLEDEYAKFPRSKHDDLLDALASIDEIAFAPDKEEKLNEPKSPNDPGYEQWYIQQIIEENA